MGPHLHHSHSRKSLTLMEQNVVAKLAKLSPTKQQQGRYTTQPTQQHAILPAVTFEQTTFLFADVLSDPLLDHGLGGVALQGSRGRQVLRQLGPVEWHLVHRLRLRFHLLHPAALARATEPGPASEEWRACSGRRGTSAVSAVSAGSRSAPHR